MFSGQPVVWTEVVLKTSQTYRLLSSADWLVWSTLSSDSSQFYIDFYFPLASWVSPVHMHSFSFNVESLFNFSFFSGCTTLLVGSQFPNQWKHGVLTTELPENSLSSFIYYGSFMYRISLINFLFITQSTKTPNSEEQSSEFFISYWVLYCSWQRFLASSPDQGCFLWE